MKKRLLILYAANSVHTSTVKDYLNAFKLYSEFEVFFADAVRDAQVGIPFSAFDYVLVHYSVRLSYEDYISQDVADELSKFKGVKALTIQDEYEGTNHAKKWMRKIGFDLVYTCVPQEFVKTIYPSASFPQTKFVSVLTGYVPEWLVQLERVPLERRKLDIVYRGRKLHYFYGRLGREKEQIGISVKKVANEANLKIDIETDDQFRIYGDSWFDFLQSSKATLASESGANIFDFDGSLRRAIDAYLLKKPLASFEEIEERLLAGLECKHAIMNQVSPKMFEAVACGTVLIMYEGHYSGIFKPDIHYIPLQKDMSNWSAVLDKLRDNNFLAGIAARAFNDIILSGDWSYRKFVALIDSNFTSTKKDYEPLDLAEGSRIVAFVGSARIGGRVANCFNQPIDHEFIAEVRRTGEGSRKVKVSTLIVEGFDLSVPGEWLRLIWISLLPTSIRKKVSKRFKNQIRSLLGLHVDH